MKTKRELNAYDRLFEQADEVLIFKGKAPGRFGLFVRIGDKELLASVEPAESINAVAERIAGKLK